MSQVSEVRSLPSFECDIVMAGGVASGIIYPGAVATIARSFRFRCIGGTSVGAIAAAVTAAAEYGRQTGANPRAFDEIADLADTLADRGPGGHSRLYHLFTPQHETRGLYDAVAALLLGGGSWIERTWRLIKASLRAPAVALVEVVVACLGIGFVWSTFSAGWLTVVEAVIAWAGLLVVIDVLRLHPATIPG